jgi:hypothetical protein
LTELVKLQRFEIISWERGGSTKKMYVTGMIKREEQPADG